VGSPPWARVRAYPAMARWRRQITRRWGTQSSVDRRNQGAARGVAGFFI